MFIPTSSTPLRFTPPSLGEDSDVAFIVFPVTEADTDAVSAQLFLRNIQPVSTDTFRATLVEELFNLYPDESVAEEKAMLLDEFWQSEDVFGDQLARWQAQEDQRRFDIAKGAPHQDQAPLPQRALGIRRRSQALLLIDSMQKASLNVRELTIKLREYEPLQNRAVTQMMLRGWEGLKTPFKAVDGMVTDECYAAVTSEIGKPAILELQQFVMSQDRLSAREVGNSELPPGSEPEATGSQEPSGELEPSDGLSTTSNIEPPLPGESVQTTDA